MHEMSTPADACNKLHFHPKNFKKYIILHCSKQKEQTPVEEEVVEVGM